MPHNQMAVIMLIDGFLKNNISGKRKQANDSEKIKEGSWVTNESNRNKDSILYIRFLYSNDSLIYVSYRDRKL
jgi:hypothetical protein